MCGITGIFNYGDQEPINRNLAAQMMNAVIHRGPDDEGRYFFDIALSMPSSSLYHRSRYRSSADD